jgi:pimeloyl-ACP methyl ester carboxylesterase
MAEACFLLVPGAGGDSWYWHRAAAELRARGHRVIAVDLPAGDDTAGFTEYADAVLASASAAGIDAGWRGELVLVAQSMAGFLAPVLCERLPVTQLVLLNAMIPVPGETFGEWWHNTGSGEARRELDLREGRPTDAEFDPVVYFLHDLPPELVEQAMREEPRQSDTVFDQAAPSTNWPAVPIRVLVGRDDRLFPAEFQRAVARERLGLAATEIPGGHLAALSHPAEFVDQLEAYLAE